MISYKKQILDDFVYSLKNGIEKSEFTDKGLIDKYFGVDIEKLSDPEFILLQPYLIDIILSTLNVAEKDYSKRDVPVVGPLLGRYLDGAKRNHNWSYRSAIGMLGYLQNSTRPDISMAVHQRYGFNANPMLCYEKAAKYISRYLLSTQDNRHSLQTG